jgi:hypothetical protein
MSRHPRFFAMFAMLLGLVISPLVRAETADANKPAIALSITTEENQKTILATVTAGGKPIKGATVTFFVKRLFGNLGIGHDQTLDDGTAAVPFPVDLPGGAKGQLHVIAAITDPCQYSSVSSEAAFDGARIVPLETTDFPRALWAPQAPLALIMAVVILLTLVWGTYFYVGVQLIKIRNGGNK